MTVGTSRKSCNFYARGGGTGGAGGAIAPPIFLETGKEHLAPPIFLD